MTSSYGPKRYAFLVGIDHYLNNGSRVLEDGNVLSVGNLQGCFNDVIAIEAFLRKRYMLKSIDILASPLPNDTSEDAAKFRDDPLLWPTYKNIRQKFENIYMSIEPGDFLFFHFSGFGAFLAPVDGSPPHEEPALLTTDFGCGQPAVRGWVLNEWLKNFADMSVHVTVSLDSCYSSEEQGKRGERYRTPNYWPWPQPIPNLSLDQYVPHQDRNSFDQDILHRSIKNSSGRNLYDDLWQWSLDHEAFTLITACLRNEMAAEKTIDGIVHGVFTYELLKYLDQDHLDQDDSFFANESIQNQLWSRMEARQRPEIYSRETQLLFFDSRFEHYYTAPLLCRKVGNKVIIPVGKAHGICLGTEFALYPRTSDDVFRVIYVEDFVCKGYLPIRYDYGIHLYLRKSCLVVPLRWSLGEAALRIVVDPSLDASWQNSLLIALKRWISSPVELVSGGEDLAGTNLLRLDVHQENVRIRGPQSLVGYENLIGHINIPLDDMRVATKSALFLAHLARFKHLLDLRETEQSEPRPFSETLELLKPADSGSRTGSNEYETRYEYALKNNSERELYFTMVVLGPQFSIEQLYPASSTRAVPPYSRRRVRFSTKLPKFPAHMTNIFEEQNRRYIIRTLVATSSHLSWDSIQLPRVWDAYQAKSPVKRTKRGFAENKNPSGKWWISNHEIITGPDRSNHLRSSIPRSSIPITPIAYFLPGHTDYEPMDMKKGVTRMPEIDAGTFKADSMPGYLMTECQPFRDVSKTLSHHIDTPNQFSAVGWELPEFIDLEECNDLGLYYLSFAVQWELPEFIASELNGNWDIKSVLTLNGTIHEPYAATCKEYVELFWPTIGFKALESMLQDIHDLFENNEPIIKMSDSITPSQDLKLCRVYSESKKTRIEVVGMQYDLICFAQLLAWLSAVFRMPKYGTISNSRVEIKGTVGTGNAERAETVISEISPKRLFFDISLVALQEIDLIKEHFCWRPLLNNTVLAEGFPIRKRNGGTPEGVMLKGFSSALVPQRRIDSESVQWHYIQSPDPEERLDINATRHLFKAGIKDLDIEILSAARSFLGYNPNVCVIVGTQRSGYESVDVSGAVRYSPGFMMETKLTPTMSLSQFGTLGIGANITYARGVYARVQQDVIRTDDRLFGSKDRPLLMYDVQNKNAFLIPEICAILELAHVWAKRQKDGHEILAKMPFSEPRWDGGMASYNAIMELKDLKLREAYAEEPTLWLMSLLRDFFKAFEVRRDVRRDNHTKFLNLEMKPVVRGWELSDIAAFESAWEKKIDLGDSLVSMKASSRWQIIPAKNKDMIVLFYRGLTQPISPENEEEACKTWTPLPPGYLLTTVQCLRQLSKTLDGSENKPKLTEKLFWGKRPNGKIFEPCGEEHCEGCLRAQRLMKKASENPLPDQPSGGIIFGKSRRT
ncbi:hypothetical protein HDV64DRAFT_284520 [Trichoderma sp. TUCIM 5745]